jgi:hypothetical protein
MMKIQENSSRESITPADWAVRAFFFVLLVLLTFNHPHVPANELDASWRMVLAKCFQDGLQFGVDVVFTYGPLGFFMGKTYAGLHYNSLLVWQAIQSVVFSLLIFRTGLRLAGYGRYAFFAFFFLLGVTYDDALHQMIIALVGFELLRRSEEDIRGLSAAYAVLLAVLALVKFTNLMLAAIFVGCTCGLQLWRKRRFAAGWLAGWGVGTFLLGWVICGQSLLNLPDYFYNSWEISQGYQETMGIPTPPDGLLMGLLTLGFVLLYVVSYLWSQQDRPRTIATLLCFGAFVFLNWKHGFVRADGHMIGFFYAVLMLSTSFPFLLQDGAARRRSQSILMLGAALSAFVGVGVAIPGLIRGLLSIPQERIYNNVTKLADPAGTLRQYEHLLTVERSYFDLPQMRAVIGKGSVDVLGFEQAVVIYNQFTYRPRPVFQSYSAYRPHLTRLNRKYYLSDRAPDFILVKLQTIDQRPMAFDDSELLPLIVQRYEYVLSEKGLHLWRRKPGSFDRGTITPRPLRTSVLAPGQPFLAEEFNDRPLWVKIDLRPSLLGRLRGFLYKLPIVHLRFENTLGMITEYRMPLPQARTGFILNPMIEDYIGYMHYAGDRADRLIRSLTVKIAPEDQIWFGDEYKVELSELPRSSAGKEYFRMADKRIFRMFDVTPEDYVAMAPLSEGTIDGRPVMVFHAPSAMTLRIPRGATTCAGAFGFLEAAYTNKNDTDGATFTISWVLGSEEILLLERTLEPMIREKDRGLQFFKVSLPPGRDGGHLRLRVHPGPRNNFSYDWTAWTGLSVY